MKTLAPPTACIRNDRWLAGLLCVGFLLGLAWPLTAVQASASMPDTSQALEQIADWLRSNRLEQAQQALGELNDQLHDTRARTQHRYLTALLLALQGETQAAEQHLQQLLDEPLDNDQHFSILVLGINVAGVQHDYQTGFERLQQALTLPLDGAPVHDQSALFSLASEMMARAGEFDEALDFAATAIRLADESGNARERCVARQRRVVALVQAGRDEMLDEALPDAERACDRDTNPMFSYSLSRHRAQWLSRQGRFDEAGQLLQAAVTMADEADYPHSQAVARTLLSEWLLHEGDIERATAMASQQLQSLRERALWGYLARAYSVLEQSSLARDDRLSALQFLRSRIDAEEQQRAQQSSYRIAYLEAAGAIQATDRIIASTREQALNLQLGQATLARNEQLRRFGWAGASVLAISLLFFILRTREDRKRFRRLANRDSLTGLDNHPRFFSEADKAFHSARQLDQPLWLLLADMDHLKRINDQFGHPLGDQALITVAKRLRNAFPPPCLIGRVGGEEFAVLMTGWTRETIEAATQRVREGLAQRPPPGLESARLSLSFGLVPLTREASLGELRQLADHALYQAKREGRDRLVCLQPMAFSS
ncbi:MAG: diguanylate cyclase domain-containing protein [Wenzhouxiangella sp.]